MFVLFLPQKKASVCATRRGAPPHKSADEYRRRTGARPPPLRLRIYDKGCHLRTRCPSFMTVFVNMRGWISVFSHLFVFRNNYEEIIRINHSDVLKHNPFSLPSK